MTNPSTGLYAVPAPGTNRNDRAARCLVLLAHPDLNASRVHRRLDAACDRLATEGLALERRDLYRLYPDYAIDVAAEQAAAARADLIVWMFPVQWYAMPALMKLWLDEVLTLGWAYGPHGATEGCALVGKDVWVVTSTGGGAASYQPDGHHQRAFADFLPPWQQAATLCGLRWWPPRVLHGAHAADDAELDAHAAGVAEHLRRYPAWSGLNTGSATDTPD